MGTYLDKFKQSLPAIQGNQILNLLNKERSDGKLQTIEEYQSKLQDLTDKLKSDVPVPISKIFLSEDGQEIDSESFNYMLSNFNDDLDALFVELELISNVAELHRSLINDTILVDIDTSLKELENAIKIYELVNRDDLGYSDVQYNDFAVPGHLNLSRDLPIANNVIVDRLDGRYIDNKYDATNDVALKKLTLPQSLGKYHNVTRIEYRQQATSVISTIDVDIPELSDTNNIINDLPGIYWATTLISGEVIDGGITIQLDVILDGTRDISFIEIEPILYNDFFISSIKYLDANNSEQTVTSSSIAISGEDKIKKISFSNITTKRIMIEFLQDNYSLLDYSYDNNINAYSLDSSVDFGSLSYQFENISSADLSKIIGAPATSVSTISGLYSYGLGIDNLRVGNSSYLHKGVFATQPIQSEDPVVLMSLQTDEIHPIIDNNASFPKGDIEYSLYKVNYQEDNAIIDTEIFPILPFTTSDIKRERLFVSPINQKGKLRFLADGGETISVYVNEETSATLIEDTHFVVTDVSNGAFSWTEIEITDTDSAYNTFSMYTVAYTPVRDDTIMNVNATVKMRNNNSIEFSNNRSAFPVHHSDIYMKIITRSNVFISDETPEINYYKLFVAPQTKG